MRAPSGPVRLPRFSSRRPVVRARREARSLHTTSHRRAIDISFRAQMLTRVGRSCSLPRLKTRPRRDARGHRIDRRGYRSRRIAGCRSEVFWCRGSARRRSARSSACGGDGLEWVSEAGPAPQLHFDEDEGIVMADDQVDLPTTCPVIALDKRVTVPYQEAQGKILTPRAERFVLQSPTPA
jgi:hypothetical protein